MKTLLVIDNDRAHNWYQIFSKVTFKTPAGDQRIRVEQCGWAQLTIVSASATEGCVVDISASEDPIFGTNQSEFRTTKVDFVLVRNYPRCVHENDYRSILLGLNYALLPSVNSLFSIYCATERALLNAELNRLARLHGDAFPFIDSYFVDNLGEGQQKAPTKYPVVVKVGSSCAGYGKMLIRNEQSFTDLRSVLMMGREYYTVESFKESLCDIRLTRVGSKSYAYKRVIANGADEWKRNTGVTKHEDLDMTPFYSNILDLAGQLFGGLDIVTVDLLALVDGSEVILEINDSASGFDDRHIDDDHRVLANLVANRMSESFKDEYSKLEVSNAESAVPRPKLNFLSDVGGGKAKLKRRKPKTSSAREAKTTNT